MDADALFGLVLGKFCSFPSLLLDSVIAILIQTCRPRHRLSCSYIVIELKEDKWQCIWERP